MRVAAQRSSSISSDIRHRCRFETTTLLISDAACAIAVRPAMGGKLACLSFHPRKLLTTGEGGAILTDDEQL